MYVIKGIDAEGKTLWLSSNGYWIPDKRNAGEFLKNEATLQVSKVQIRNSRLGLSDQIEPSIEKK